MRDGEIVPASGSSNFMGNGITETTWVWAGTEVECLYERMEYTPGRWPEQEHLESCRHWTKSERRDA